MSFKSKLFFSLFFSFFLFSIAFAFSFSGFDYPLRDYEKKDDSGKLEGTFNWYVSLGLGESWSFASGHLGEDFLLSKEADKVFKDEKDRIEAEISQPVYAIGDGIVFKTADWPSCGYCGLKTEEENKNGCKTAVCTLEDGIQGCWRNPHHGWGGVVLIKHQIPDDNNGKFNLNETILPDPMAEDKELEQASVKKTEEQGTKVVYSMYGHLKNIQVKEGSLVKKGDKVGEIVDVCKKNSYQTYGPHLHFEIKSQDATEDAREKIDGIPGVGKGYSGITSFAPNRYIPSKFIENNRNLIIEEKTLTQKIKEIVSFPEGLAGGEENLSFWDKVKFYTKGAVWNIKEFFGISPVEETGEKQLAADNQQQATDEQKAEDGPPPLPSASEKAEDGPPPFPSTDEVWSQEFFGKDVLFTVSSEGAEAVRTVILQFKNTGNTVWTKDKVSLNIIQDRNSTASKFYHSSWLTKKRPSTFKESEVGPGELATFEFIITFPQEEGKYYPQFRPVYFDGKDFYWIGKDKGIFVAEVGKKGSGFEFAAGSAYDIAKEVFGGNKAQDKNAVIETVDTADKGSKSFFITSVNSGFNPAPIILSSAIENPSSPPQLALQPVPPENTVLPEIHFKELSSVQPTSSFKIEWEVKDGEVIENFEIQYQEIDGDWQSWLKLKETQVLFDKGKDEKTYRFRVRALDKNGNPINLEGRNGDIANWIESGKTTINLLPAASFINFPAKEFIGVNETVVFDATLSKPAQEDGKIISYNWDFEDGNSDFSEDKAKTEHTYSVPGDYNVVLTVKDNLAKENSIIKPIKVRKLIAEEEWSKTFGGKDWDEGYSVKQTSDGGYVIVGFTFPPPSEGTPYRSDVYLVKTDKDGNKLWEKTFGGELYGKGYFVEEVSDEGYAIGGFGFATSASGAKVPAFSLIKTDFNGEEKWHQLFPIPGISALQTVGGMPLSFFSFAGTGDNGYIVAGRAVFPHPSISSTFLNNIWLVKLNSAGEKEWEKVYEEENNYFSSAVQQTTDEGYIIIGFTDKNWQGNPPSKKNDYDVYLIKTDSEGNKEWEKTYGIGNYDRRSDFALSGQQTSDSGYIITGFAAVSGGGVCDIFILKTDSGGDEEWMETFNFQNWDWAYSVKETSDGGYIIAGGTTSVFKDLYLIKTDLKGNIIWSKVIGGKDKDEIGYSIEQTSDDGYIIVGVQGKEIDADVWLIKLSAETPEE